MGKQSSDHVKPCNIGQSEAHNRRDEVYLAHINERNIYIRRDLMADNDSWTSSLMEGRDLRQYYDDIARMVKEKTGRALQTKERKVVNKKTGRIKTISGSSPIRESVVVCKADTTIEQLQRYCQQCHEQFGITAIQIHIHRDEGHYENPADKASWKPNYHAHIVWDWMNHETGKSCKLNADDMRLMQDMVATALEMERGTSKAETDRQHLERNDFIVAKQKAEAEKAQRTTEEELRKSELLQRENEAKEQTATDLDRQIAEKADKANREHGNRILQGGAAIANALANKAGMGKYAAIEKENAELKASVPKRLEELQRQFDVAVSKAVEERAETLNREAERYKTRCFELNADYNRLVTAYNDMRAGKQRAEAALLEYKRGEEQRFNAFTAQSKWKDDVLISIALMFAKADKMFRQAVDAIVKFAKNAYKSFFTNEEAAAIKATMTNLAGEHGDHRAIGKWLVMAAKAEGNLTERAAARAAKEVDDVAIGRYDHRISRSGGIKL